jgi:DtxR family Mn-dependent transcriptional regulator
MPTSTVEDYLKRIYLEQQAAPEARVATGQIAQSLSVTPGTATAMIKTLADSGLVDHEPYAGVRLTHAGKELATRVIRRHRLVELFLVEVMGMNWSEVHAEAEILEHAVSERLIERIDSMLGRPASDPHGDPIPTSLGEFVSPQAHESLIACPLGAPRVVARVTDQRADFLRLVEAHGLMPGQRVTVRARDELMDSVEVLPDRREPLRLGFRAASRVLVLPEAGLLPVTAGGER